MLQEINIFWKNITSHSSGLRLCPCLSNMYRRFWVSSICVDAAPLETNSIFSSWTPQFTNQVTKILCPVSSMTYNFVLANRVPGNIHKERHNHLQELLISTVCILFFTVRTLLSFYDSVLSSGTFLLWVHLLTFYLKQL